MNISKVEEFIGYTMTKEILKEAVGDGMEFEIMYQAVLDSIKEQNSELNSEESENYIDNLIESVSSGRIDDLPMTLKGEDGENIYRRSPISLNLQNTYKNIVSNNTVSNDYSNITNNVNSSYTQVEGDELQRIYDAVDKYSNKYGVDKDLVLAIIKQESNFNPNAVSGAGAMGLMQLMDFNCNTYGISDPLNIEQNIEGGVKHIKMCLDLFNGDVEMALMAYNAGQGTMSRRGVTSAADLYKMPEETQNYVPKVMSYYRNGV